MTRTILALIATAVFGLGMIACSSQADAPTSQVIEVDFAASPETTLANVDTEAELTAASSVQVDDGDLEEASAEDSRVMAATLSNPQHTAKSLQTAGATGTPM